MGSGAEWEMISSPSKKTQKPQGVNNSPMKKTNLWKKTENK